MMSATTRTTKGALSPPLSLRDVEQAIVYDHDDAPHEGPPVLRATDLTLEEKLNLLTGDSFWSLPSVHGLPALILCDGPHGVRKQLRDRSFTTSLPATCFPTAAALACSWDDALLYRIGQALQRECDWYDVHVLLGPGINIKRHPSGGRNFEYFSEDPCLSAQLAIAYIKGVQASGTTAACLKHFAVNNQETHRFVVNAIVDPRTLQEIYLDQFRQVITAAQPAMVMTAYNQLNGTYCSEHEYLLQTFLRQSVGWDGVTVSDWGATNARVAGLRVGLDLEMPGSHGVHNTEVRKCLDEGSLTMVTMDESVDRILRLIQTYGTKKKRQTTIRNGSTSTTTTTPPTTTSEDRLFQESYQLAYEAALSSIVLLKNDQQVLPLDIDTIHSIALIGEFGKDHPRYQGMGSSKVNSTKVKSLYAALRESHHFGVDQIHYAPGYHPDDEDLTETNELLLQQAAEAAQKADAVILCIGLPEIMESEGFDRTHLAIPAQHAALVDVVCRHHQKVIVVLSNGGVIELPWFDQPAAILETYLAGEAGGPAAIDAIFGLATPCGKLAESWPLYATDLPADVHFPGSRDVVEYREGLCVGYRHLDTVDAAVRFPFGYGLSYTDFVYENVQFATTRDEPAAKQVVVSLQVRNAGQVRAGREIVQVYVRHTNASVFRPAHELKGFCKTPLLQPGETSETVTVVLDERAFSYYDPEQEKWIVEKDGLFDVEVAAHSRDVRAVGRISFTTGGDEPSESTRAAYNVTEPLVDAHSFAHRFECRDSVRSDLELRDDIHRNSLLKDVAGQSWLGRLLLSFVFQSAMKEVAPKPPPHSTPHHHHHHHHHHHRGNHHHGNHQRHKHRHRRHRRHHHHHHHARERKLVEATVSNLPLRALVLFSRGAMTFEILDALILLMNLRYFAALASFGKAFYLATVGWLVVRGSRRRKQ